MIGSTSQIPINSMPIERGIVVGKKRRVDIDLLRGKGSWLPRMRWANEKALCSDEGEKIS